jgi:hypothetical protein
LVSELKNNDKWVLVRRLVQLETVTFVTSAEFISHFLLTTKMRLCALVALDRSWSSTTPSHKIQQGHCYGYDVLAALPSNELCTHILFVLSFILPETEVCQAKCDNMEEECQ